MSTLPIVLKLMSATMNPYCRDNRGRQAVLLLSFAVVFAQNRFMSTMMMKNNLELFYQNVRGLRTKSSLVFSKMSLIDADIFLLTETWLNVNHCDSNFFPEGYCVERRDRSYDTINLQRGGGVCAVIRQSIKYTRRVDLECFPECLWLEVRGSHSKLLLGLFYVSSMISGGGVVMLL